MINKRKEVKDILHEALVKEVDPIMLDHGFTRIRKALIYKRKVDFGLQTLFFHPSLYAKGYARIYPYIEFHSQTILDTAWTVFKTKKPFNFPCFSNAFYSDRILSGNIELFVPMPTRCKYLGVLYASAAYDMVRVAKICYEIINNWCLPFMDTHKTYGSIEYFEDPPNCSSIIHSILGYIYCKRYKEALRVLDDNLHNYDFGGYDQVIRNYINSQEW